MLKTILAVIILLTSLNTSASKPYDPSLDAKTALERIKELDCSVSLEVCRYYATVEYVAAFHGVKIDIEKTMKKSITDKDSQEISSVLNRWHVWKDAKLKNAVLEVPNPLLEFLKKEVVEHYKNPTMFYPLSFMYQFDGIQKQSNPEEFSIILEKSKNYHQWLNSLPKKE